MDMNMGFIQSAIIWRYVWSRIQTYIVFWNIYSVYQNVLYEWPVIKMFMGGALNDNKLYNSALQGTTNMVGKVYDWKKALVFYWCLKIYHNLAIIYMCFF